jgi:hypothetical protein
MINHPDQSKIYLTWQAIMWRLLLTLLLLVALAGSGLNLFSAISTPTETQTLPSFPQEMEAGR